MSLFDLQEAEGYEHEPTKHDLAMENNFKEKVVSRAPPPPPSAKTYQRPFVDPDEVPTSTAAKLLHVPKAAPPPTVKLPLVSPVQQTVQSKPSTPVQPKPAQAPPPTAAPIKRKMEAIVEDEDEENNNNNGEDDDDDDDNDDDDEAGEDDGDKPEQAWVSPALRINELKRAARPEKGSLKADGSASEDDGEDGDGDDDDNAEIEEKPTLAHALLGDKGMKRLMALLADDPVFQNGLPASSLVALNSTVSNILLLKDPTLYGHAHGLIGDSSKSAEMKKIRDYKANLAEAKKIVSDQFSPLEGQFKWLDEAVNKYGLVRSCVTAVLECSDDDTVASRTIAAMTFDPFREDALARFCEESWGARYDIAPIADRRYAIFELKKDGSSKLAPKKQSTLAETFGVKAAGAVSAAAAASSATTSAQNREAQKQPAYPIREAPRAWQVFENGQMKMRASRRDALCHSVAEQATSANATLLPNGIFAALLERNIGRALHKTPILPPSERMQAVPNSFVWYLASSICPHGDGADEFDVKVADFCNGTILDGEQSYTLFFFAHALFGWFPMQANLDAAESDKNIAACVLSNMQLETVESVRGIPEVRHVVLQKNELPLTRWLNTRSANTLRLLRALWIEYTREIGFPSNGTGTHGQYVAARQVIGERRPSLIAILRSITSHNIAAKDAAAMCVCDALDTAFEVLIQPV